MTKKKRKSKSSKSDGNVFSFSSVLFYLIAPIVGLIFISLILKTEIKFLYKNIDSKEKQLEVLQNKLESKLVNVQKLSAENRIVEYAKENLGMVRINSVVENIYVDELKLKKIKKIVKSKYE